MKISGIQKTSLIDYPGYISTIIFTQGCNYRCPYCHNPSLIAADSNEESYLSVNKVMSFLKKRKGLIDALSITGGEPTIQADLKEFITEIRTLGLKIKLDTNGSKPGILETLIQAGILDYIAMDIKSSLNKYPKTTGSKFDFLSSIRKSINIIQKSGLDYEFRTTVVPGFHENEDFKDIGLLIEGAEKYYIQNFKADICYNSKLMGITSFPLYKLEDFQKIIAPYVQTVYIRE
ncbi:MAG: anaerobic ribonucleoside-triphosphate reductase activating protein [Firmicutes bacterium]|nr:anaerobic ribonucleoside-triphosphate reductase activating protein [Bacillota bacterium]